MRNTILVLDDYHFVHASEFDRLVEQIVRARIDGNGSSVSPKRLRLYFMYDRKLLADLSRCAWRVLAEYLKQSVPCNDAAPRGRTKAFPLDIDGSNNAKSFY